MIRRSTHLLARAVGALLGITTLGLVVAVWRLTSGPVPLTFLSGYVQESLANSSPGYTWEFEQTILDWSDLRPALAITITGVRVRDSSGALIAEAPRVEIGLSARALLSGILAPTVIELEGPSVTLLRLQDGRFKLGIAVMPEMSEQTEGPDFSKLTGQVFAALLAPPGSAGQGGALTRFAARDVALVYRDLRLGTKWEASGANFIFERSEQGITADAMVAVKIADQTWSLGLTGGFTQSDQEIRLDIAFADVEPFRIAGEAEMLAPLAQLRLPVSGTVGLRIMADGAVNEIRADIRSGSGEIEIPELFPEPVHLDSFEIAGEYALDANMVRLDKVKLRQGALEINATGAAEYGVASPAIQVSGDVTGASIEGIKRLWPIPVGTGSRGWFLKNLDTGNVSRAHFDIDIPSGATAAGPLPDNAIRIDLQFSEVAGHYLRPMPPIVNASGSASITGRRLELVLDDGVILDDLRIAKGKFILENTHLPDKDGEVSIVLNGSMTRTLQVIDYQPLGYPSKYGIDPNTIGGEAGTRINLKLPIKDHMQMSEIKFAVASNIRGLRFPGLLNGIALEQGDLLLELNGKGLKAKGIGRFLDVPAELSWTETFGVQKGPTSAFTAKAVADERQLETLGFPTVGLIRGPAEIMVEMRGRGSKIAGGALRGDLTNAELIAEPISWRKPIGKAARIAFDFVFSEDGAELQNLQLTGDEIDVAGRIKFGVKGPPEFVKIERLTLGKNNKLRGEARLLPSGAYAISVNGSKADLSLSMANLKGGPSGEEPAGLPFDIAARLDEVVLREGSVLKDVIAAGSYDGDDFRQLSGDGNFGPGLGVVLRLEPGADGNRTLSLISKDAGKILYGLDLFDSGVGGIFEMTAKFQDSTLITPKQEPPMIGEIRIRKLQAVNAPVLARLLTIASLTGIVDLLSSRGVTFERVYLPFEVRDGVTSVKDAYASGSELGITLDGTMTSGSNGVDMKGTVIPAHTLNTVFGKIPLLGNLLLGGKNEGIIAISYYASGSSDDPKILVNPLSALTPGFLRRIFDLGDLAEKPPASPPDAPASPAP